jgi:hypothetical protein
LREVCEEGRDRAMLIDRRDRDKLEAIEGELREIGADPDAECVCMHGKNACRRHPWRSAGVRFVVVPGRRLSDDKPTDIVITEIANRWTVEPIGYARDEVHLLEDVQPQSPVVVDERVPGDSPSRVVFVTDGNGNPLVSVPPGRWSLADIVRMNPATRITTDGKGIVYEPPAHGSHGFIKP